MPATSNKAPGQKKAFANLMVYLLLKMMAESFRWRRGLKKYLESDEGWLNFSVGIRTESGSIENSIFFKNGRVSVSRRIPSNVDVVMIFISTKALRKLLTAPTTEQVYMLLKSEMRTEGKQTYLLLFLFLVSVLLHRQQIKNLKKEHKKANEAALA